MIKNKAIILFLVCLVSCSNRVQVENESNLVDIFFSAIEAHKTQSISFKALTSFEWDKVCIFPPYTPVDSINSNLGFNWALSDKTNIQHDDVSCLIVFTRQNEVVKYLLYPRNKGDFSSLPERCFSQEEAVYTVKERDNNGSIWYIIKSD